MEEILASIRRIIADDQMLPLTRPSLAETFEAPTVRAPTPTSVEANPLAMARIVEAPRRAPLAPSPAPRPVSTRPALSERSAAGDDRFAPIQFEVPVRAPKPFVAAAAPVAPQQMFPPAVVPPPPAASVISAASAEATAAIDSQSGPDVVEALAYPYEDGPQHAYVAAEAQPTAAQVFAQGTAQVSAPLPRLPVAREETLLSAKSGASVSSAFETLATTMFLQNSGMIEEACRDLLRPMLKSWLDDNLPVLVERLVRVEIERVARGGR